MNFFEIPCVKEQIDRLPSTTGVYLFVKNGKIQYIGKSVNIKARVLSHLENAKMSVKEAAIVHADTIRYVVTDSEFKALLLEADLIQKHHPKYNVIWKDDKSYLYIKITVKDEFPKLFPVRKENDGKSLYFGPFSSLQQVQELLKEIRKVFPFCSQRNMGKRACFYSKIRQCNPCPNIVAVVSDPAKKQQLKKIYNHNIRQVIRVLRGNTAIVLKNLYKEMEYLSKNQSYEEALALRDKILFFEGVIRNKVFEDRGFFLHNKTEGAVKQLVELLQPYFPNLAVLHRIECYDISNTMLQQATASMVVLTGGAADKSQYRKFKIKNVKARSDFEMLEEVFRRRFARKDWELPNLIVVDGGKPQVRVVEKVLKAFSVVVPLIGIAKNPDRLVVGGDAILTIRPSRHNGGFNLIRMLRDESHRFAKKYHVMLRNRKLL